MKLEGAVWRTGLIVLALGVLAHPQGFFVSFIMLERSCIVNEKSEILYATYRQHTKRYV